MIQIKLRFFLLLVLAAAGQLSQAAQTLPLWEARGQGSTIYLLGSVHVCKPSCYPLSNAILKRFDASGTLAVELDPRNEQLGMTVMQAGMLPPGEKLESKLSSPAQKNLNDALAVLGLPSSAMSMFRPWLAGTVLTVAAAGKNGFSADQGIDLQFANQAQAQGKPLLELETAERQLAAFAGSSEREQVEGLQSVLDMILNNRLPSYLNEMIEAWRVGDGKKLDALMRESEGKGRGMREELLDKRNVEMVDKIAKSTSPSRPLFVVVGIAHLVGPNNIGDLLAKRGFTVRQIKEGE